MSAEATLLALTVLDSLLTRAAAVNAIILAARKEGRDVNEQELDAAVSADDAAKTVLEDAIAKAKAEGR